MSTVSHAPLDITVRVGCRQTYEAVLPTDTLIIVKPHHGRTQEVTQERFTIAPDKTGEECQDWNGNTVYRFAFPTGQTVIEHDALVKVSSEQDNHGLVPRCLPLSDVPTPALRYIFPSRYCDSDKLMELAKKEFGKIPRGIDLVQAICDWTHHKIEYRTGVKTSTLAASEIIQQGYGVCKDYAHVAIALCRCFELPTRYVSGHLANIGRKTTEPRMDFHGYFEVYLGDWFTFDARFNVPRRGRIKVAHGLDASETQISTGEVSLKDFKVWAYQVNPTEVSVGDPIDLSKRLDGTEEVRRV